jgi:hypothetical protein
MTTQQGRILPPMPDSDIDLNPLLADPAAAQIMMLARGQLNRAFRVHGLNSPDPLTIGNEFKVDAKELDDPAALGVESAEERFGACFRTWSARMPSTLGAPVLAILHKTYQALECQADDPDGTAAAVLKAYEFLLARVGSAANDGPMAPNGGQSALPMSGAHIAGLRG